MMGKSASSRVSSFSRIDAAWWENHWVEFHLLIQMMQIAVTQETIYDMT